MSVNQHQQQKNRHILADRNAAEAARDRYGRSGNAAHQTGADGHSGHSPGRRRIRAAVIRRHVAAVSGRARRSVIEWNARSDFLEQIKKRRWEIFHGIRRIRRHRMREQIVDTLTHGTGFALAIAALVVLTVQAAITGGALRVAVCAIFGATLVILYAASTIYHALHHTRARRLFQRLDHISIFLLIAGSYTPFALINIGGAWGWSIFGIVWGIAIVGITLKAIIGERFEYLWVGMYLAMGWIAVIGLKPLMESIPGGGLALLVAGGGAYTAGVIFFAWEKLPFNHGIWHLFVLLGSLFHFIAAYQYVALA